MADRKHRATVVEIGAPIADHTTEQIDAVMPAFGNTVTITEIGTDLFSDSPTQDHRATLVLVSGPTPGEVYSLDEETVIGRDPLADIVIEDSAVSRRHVRIDVRDGMCVVEDLGSANGTYVDGARVSRRAIDSGDRIQLGPRVVLRFALLDEAELTMHRQLFESSTRDALTGALNKKYITERLVAEVAHAVRHSSSLELVVFDLDKFKQVNDQHGHLVGDLVLRAVSDRVHSVIRSEDVFGRFGGEEFVVVSRGSDAAKLAERIRVAIEQLSIPSDRGAVHVTLSLGVARLDEVVSEASANALLEMADRRLMDAKRAGRNRVRAHD